MKKSKKKEQTEQFKKSTNPDKPSWTQWLGSGFLLLAFLTGGLLVFFTHGQKIFSESENRVLEPLPVFTVEDWLDSTFQSKMETALNDQMQNRDLWVRFNRQMKRSLGFNQFDNVIISENGAYMQPFTLDMEKDCSRLDLLRQMGAFAEEFNELKVSVMLVPNAIGIYPEQADTFAYMPKQLDVLDLLQEQVASMPLNWIDVASVLMQHQEEMLFYHTDHHWTTKAAKLAAELFLETSLEGWQEKVVNEHFVGSLAKKLAEVNSDDVMTIYTSDQEPNYIVETPDGQSTSVYHAEAQFSSDPYTLFFGGNYPTVKIQTAQDTKKNLLIFKDSYANCFVPFLIPSYEKIIMVDPRYYFDDVRELMKQEEINEVLFLYNMNTFFLDEALIDCIAVPDQNADTKSDTADSAE